jgi:hypothetical protein
MAAMRLCLAAALMAGHANGFLAPSSGGTLPPVLRSSLRRDGAATVAQSRDSKTRGAHGAVPQMSLLDRRGVVGEVLLSVGAGALLQVCGLSQRARAAALDQLMRPLLACPGARAGRRLGQEESRGR